MITKTRSPEYDIAKGIGVLLVVVGHLPGLPFPLLVWIFSFHVPLYFFISGLFVKKDNSEPFSVALKKNLKGLLLPYCVFSLVFILLDVLIRDPFSSPKLEVKLFLTGQGGYAVLWFFFVLFMERLILDILKRIVKKRVLLSLIYLCFVIAGFLLHRLFFFNSFKIATILYASGFYYLGFLMKDTPLFQKLTDKRRWYLIPLYLAADILGTFVLVRLYGNTMDLNSATSYDILLNYATAFAGIFFTLMISKLLAGNLIGKAFEYVGRNSLYFYPLMAYIPFKFLYLCGGTAPHWQQAISYVAACLVSVLTAEIAGPIKKRRIKKTA